MIVTFIFTDIVKNNEQKQHPQKDPNIEKGGNAVTGIQRPGSLKKLIKNKYKSISGMKLP